MRNFLLFMFLLPVLFSCHFKRKGQEKPLAKVYDQYLYPSDLKWVITTKLPPKDSAALVSSYIESWVKKQLILNKAELNLTDDQKDVELLLEDYRTSLIIFRYEQQLIRQKIDTVVTNKEIDDYYSSNTANFVLNENIVKALFIKLPVSAPDIAKLKVWYKSGKSTDLALLESYCFKYAKKYDYFNDGWVSLNEILLEIPSKVEDQATFLEKNSFLESKDSIYNYFLNIREYKTKGTIAPISFVKSNIKDIILNKRKLAFVNELENNIYNDASDRNYFKIYKK
jgi:hypothetical protein